MVSSSTTSRTTFLESASPIGCATSGNLDSSKRAGAADGSAPPVFRPSTGCERSMRDGSPRRDGSDGEQSELRRNPLVPGGIRGLLPPLVRLREEGQAPCPDRL